MPETTVREVRHHFQRAGVKDSAMRVVFVHGLLGDLSSLYFVLGGAVAEFADVMLYDLRGHGLSERVPSGYSVEELMLDLVAVVDETLGTKPVILVGHSFGAALAVRFAQRYPKRTRGLVMIDGHLADEDFAARILAPLEWEPEERDRRLSEFLAAWPRRDNERNRRRLAEHTKFLVEETTILRDLRSTPTLSTKDFARITVPSLAIYGDRSDALESSAPLLSAMPNGRIEILPDCTHAILWEQPVAVKRLVTSFCRELGETP